MWRSWRGEICAHPVAGEMGLTKAPIRGAVMIYGSSPGLEPSSNVGELPLGELPVIVFTRAPHVGDGGRQDGSACSYGAGVVASLVMRSAISTGCDRWGQWSKGSSTLSVARSAAQRRCAPGRRDWSSAHTT